MDVRHEKKNEKHEKKRNVALTHLKRISFSWQFFFSETFLFSHGWALVSKLRHTNIHVFIYTVYLRRRMLG